jgi:kinetochore protein Mis12/MTW1
LSTASPSKAKSSTQTPLTTTAEFTTSQLPSLKNLLAELKPKLASLPGSEAELRERHLQGDRVSDERKRYVENVARRAVRDTVGSVRSRGEERELGALRFGSEVSGIEGLAGRGADVKGKTKTKSKSERRSGGKRKAIEEEDDHGLDI